MTTGSKPGGDEIGNLLHACLELIEGGEESLEALLEGYNNLRDMLQPPLEAALWLCQRSWLFDPSPAFISASRRRIVAQVQTQKGIVMAARTRYQDPEGSSLPRWNFLFLWMALVSILALVWIGGRSFSLWVGNSIPGDPLFGAKLAQEQLQMAFTFSAEKDIESSIRFVEARLIETERLIITGRDGHLPQAVENLRRRLNGTILEIEQMAEENPEQAGLYAGKLESAVRREAEKLAALREFYPRTTREMIDQVLAISLDGLQAINLQD